jgi:hypothetical protein
MADTVRLALYVVIAAAGVTLLGSLFAWWVNADRRMRLYVKRALGGEPDAIIIARTQGSAAGFRLAAGQIVVMRRKGAEALLYWLDMLDGAELIIDDVVVGRVHKGEARRALDEVPRNPGPISLRLLFNNAAHPEFELDLWRPEDANRRGAPHSDEIIHEARTWLARVDALVRRSAPRPQQPSAGPLFDPPWEDDEADIDV